MVENILYMIKLHSTRVGELRQVARGRSFRRVADERPPEHAEQIRTSLQVGERPHHVRRRQVPVARQEHEEARPVALE